MVENDPTHGHVMPNCVGSSNKDVYDDHHDLRRTDQFYSSLGKSTVWAIEVLDAQDQLWQRMAWALSLSQIFVASAVSHEWLSEKLQLLQCLCKGSFR